MLKGRCVLLVLVLVLVLALVASQATAATVHIGQVALNIPAPAGFTQVTPQMHRVDAATRATVNAMNVQLAVFIPAKDRDAALNDSIQHMPRNFRVQTIKQYVNRDVSLTDFAHLEQVVDRSNQSMIHAALAAANRDLANHNAKRIDHLSPGLAVKLNGLYVYPVHRRTRRTIAYSLQATVHASQQGHTLDEVVSGTAIYVLVGKRVLFLYVYGARDDLKWTRVRATQWARAVLAANGTSDQVIKRGS